MNEILMCGTDPVGQLYKDTKAEATSIAPIEVSPTESSHNVGTHIMYGGIRYKVTSSISVGDTLTIGENIIAENVEDNIVYSDGTSVKDKIDSKSGIKTKELSFTFSNNGLYALHNDSNIADPDKILKIHAKNTATTYAILLSTYATGRYALLVNSANMSVITTEPTVTVIVTYYE